MEEKRNEKFIPSHPSLMDVAKAFSEVSRESGRYKFLITFTATKGNIEVLQKFQKFAFDNCNNEYIVAITRLMDYGDIFNYLKSLESRVSILEEELVNIKTQPKVEEEKKKDEGIKTF